MHLEEIRAYCLSKPFTSEDMPFDDTTLVFRVHKKIFALLSLDKPFQINLKCAPEKAIELRENHAYIVPGYHMNKTHWNTVKLEDSGINPKLLKELIDDSYSLIVQKLPKALKATIL